MKFYLYFFIFLLSFNSVYGLITDFPIDCDPTDPNIFPGQVEICNDGIDNNCNVDEGFLFDDDPTTGVDENDIACCNIVNVRWTFNNVEVSKVSDATTVTLEAIGTGACNGETSNFQIWENDIISDQQIPFFETTVFSGGVAKTTWFAEWVNDCFFPLRCDPEYYFEAASEFITQRSPDLDVTLGQAECGDGNLDLDETCLSCPEDAGCGLNEKGCDIGGVATCIPFTDVCSSPITPDDCSSNLCCFPGDVCQIVSGNPTCACNSASDGICSSNPACQNLDPDCCIFTDVSWSKDCVANGQPVDLIIETNDACNFLEASFDIKEQDPFAEEDVSPDPPNRQIINNQAVRRWIAVWMADGIGNPEYFFYADIPSITFAQVKSDELEVRPCNIAIDSDCDGVADVEDVCANTRACTSTNSQGCEAGQASCIKAWDCTGVPWIDMCDELGIETRDVTLCIYDPDGDGIGNPHNVPGDPCSTEALLTDQRACGDIRPFPAFNAFNVITVLVLLALYYTIKKYSKT